MQFSFRNEILKTEISEKNRFQKNTFLNQNFVSSLKNSIGLYSI